MRSARKLILHFLGDEEGATAIEYALIAGLICLAIVGGATAIGTSTGESFNEAAAGLA